MSTDASLTAHNRSTAGAIGATMLAGALWGLVFLAPELVPGFSALQLSAGRYLAYGASAALLILPCWPRLRRMLTRTPGAWGALCALALSGNIVYYLFLANAVRLGGVAMASIVIGLLPIAVTLVGSREPGAAPLRRLVPSLLLGGAGLACIAWDAVMASACGASSAPSTSLAGLACALGALASWTFFAVHNRRWLGRIDGVSAHEWNLAVGVVTGLQALVLAVPAFVLTSTIHAAHDWLRFGAVAASVAILCSLVGNGLWNSASRVLPMSMLGQMIVFETIFAALYGFVWEGRWPRGLEIAALALLAGGVVSCAMAHRTNEDTPREDTRRSGTR